MRKLFVVLLLLGCGDPTPPFQPIPQQREVPRPAPPRVYSRAEQQIYNCKKLCTSQSLAVARATTGSNPVCECGAAPTPASHGEQLGVGTGVEVGIGMEVGRHVGRAVINEFLR